ncbi:MOSC and FAD-binding oxidoreductase domain-containing protein [Mycolicibacterium tusciae]|uniref:MOSC and FAD-binding oxidoreductase domain-containing protein n=1 Tax=Mycolicibacterium tusciae TaxID=75922 RepID=UPI00024A1293|nr:MOSC and FAD-binding oxidoreductase domain-containing protein [Mycolicibacterium tusciae]
MSVLVSVNVGMPADVAWRDKTVHTGIYKGPVDGPVMVRRLNVDGDGQGDLGGHGGEQRAVMVYQTESYDHWRRHFGRDDLTPGMFGENFTITGLGDDEVCIGDRYRIGDAEFEVTQPRVTCFRVGMRLGEPEMPNLLVAHHRPGFYFRVISEGHVAAGDEIVRTRRGRHQLSVADIDALLYLPDRDVGMLRKAVDLPALSPGWRQSFTELLAAQGNPAGATPAPVGVEPGWHGFRTLRVAQTRRESAAVLSIELEASDGGALPAARPGQFLTLRVPDGEPAPLRSYSLSSSGARYRISVKREDHGRVSGWIHANVRAGTAVDAAAPRGDFYLDDDTVPVIFVSAGIGVTPVLAMLHALGAQHSEREIWWLHITRDAQTLAFGGEVGELIDSLANARQRVFFTAESGRPDAAAVAALGLPHNAVAYLCGPQPFMADMRSALAGAGLGESQIRSELFGALPPINPGITDRPHRMPHLPDGPPGTGPAVSFARSGITVNWSENYGSMLELAEACDVPTRFSCRSGVCHICVTPLVDGTITYRQPPLELPAEGSVLICSAQPCSGVVLDL